MPNPLDLDQMMTALDKINDASSVAQKYGPFYFALVLLLFVPLVASPFIKRFAASAGDAKTRIILIENYSLYLKLCLFVGVFCTLASVAWWLFEGYRQDDLMLRSLNALRAEVAEMKSRETAMRYTTIGYIENTTDLRNEFINTLGRPSVVFSRQGWPGNTWLFAVISDQPIQPSEPVPIILEYTVPSTNERIFWHLDFPIKASATPIAYKFTVDQDGAHIQANHQ
jgi:hypothetical protein